MTVFAPLETEYIVLRIDPVAVAEILEDPILLDAAKSLTPKSYLAYVAKSTVLDFPMPNKPAREIRVQFVGQGLPTRFPRDNVDETMCIPILPETKHPLRRRPLKPQPTFPFANCYHYFCLDHSVCVPVQPFEPDQATSLPDKEMIRCQKYMEEDIYRLYRGREARVEHGSVDSDSCESDFPSPSQQKTLSGRSSVASSQEYSSSVSSSLPPEPNAPSPHCNEAHSTSKAYGVDVLADTYVVATSREPYVRSTHPYPRDIDAEKQFLRDKVFGQSDGDKIKLAPLVYVSLDLSELKEIPDPNGFRDEVEELLKLIKESREREARASEMQAMEHAAGSSHSSWIDLGDMIDIDRADAFGTQWQPQPRWYRRCCAALMRMLKMKRITISQYVVRTTRAVRRRLSRRENPQ